jgi:uncharacterized protein
LKFALLLLAVIALFWLLRGGRQRVAPPPAGKPAAPAEPLPIVACAQCGVHLPIGEALPGRGGVFCGAAHRADYEQAHPPA